jgi:hypothetical protein
MLRLFMIVSGSLEALFSLSALVATAAVVGALGDGVDDSVIFLPGCSARQPWGLGLPTGLALAPMWL